MGRKIDITGQKFGHLTVVAEDPIRHNNRLYWLCQCDCGNPELKSVESYHLRKGQIVSCGCENKKKAAERIKQYHYDVTKNEIGNRYGKLTVIK